MLDESNRDLQEAIDLYARVTDAASPDGQHLSYVDWSIGNLALRDLASEESRPLTHKGDWSDSNEYAEVSVWSPDGEQVVYTWFNRGFELRIVGRDGAEPRVLYNEVPKPASCSIVPLRSKCLFRLGKR